MTCPDCGRPSEVGRLCAPCHADRLAHPPEPDEERWTDEPPDRDAIARVELTVLGYARGVGDAWQAGSIPDDLPMRRIVPGHPCGVRWVRVWRDASGRRRHSVGDCATLAEALEAVEQRAAGEREPWHRSSG